MKKITILPKFMPGQVIDLSYKSKGLPNRILIQSVFVREHDDQWMYNCILESTGESTTLCQSVISDNMANKNMPVYQCAEIIRLYNDGWRFCGNHKRSHAHSIAGKNATNGYIRNIILRPALDSKGCLQNDYYGMWIRYNNTINADGTVIIDNKVSDDVIVVK